MDNLTYPLIKTPPGSALADSFLKHYSIFGLKLRSQDTLDKEGQ